MEGEECGTASFVTDGLLMLILWPGIITERSYAFDASTPWKQIRALINFEWVRLSL
jgi:hypothetical protein